MPLLNGGIMMEMQEKAYWISEVAELTEMNVNTIRKYCLLLEQNGYKFKRDEQDRRAFVSRDITAIQEINKLKRVDKMPLEEAVKSVSVRFFMESTTTETMSVTPSITVNNAILSALQEQLNQIQQQVQQQQEHMDRQEAFNQTLLNQLKKRDEYIEATIRTRDQNLMLALNEILETKRMIAAAQEAPAPKKKWFQFWK
jgi:DNA-binding transcriptional MerR regulator